MTAPQCRYVVNGRERGVLHCVEQRDHDVDKLPHRDGHGDVHYPSAWHLGDDSVSADHLIAELETQIRGLREHLEQLYDDTFGMPVACAMNLPSGPVCACGMPSRHESGWCGRESPACPVSVAGDLASQAAPDARPAAARRARPELMELHDQLLRAAEHFLVLAAGPLADDETETLRRQCREYGDACAAHNRDGGDDGRLRTAHNLLAKSAASLVPRLIDDNDHLRARLAAIAAVPTMHDKHGRARRVPRESYLFQLHRADTAEKELARLLARVQELEEQNACFRGAAERKINPRSVDFPYFVVRKRDTDHPEVMAYNDRAEAVSAFDWLGNNWTWTWLLVPLARAEAAEDKVDLLTRGEHLKPGGPLHVALWDAINAYAVACGADAARISDARMDAVAKVEEALRLYASPAAPKDGGP